MYSVLCPSCHFVNPADAGCCRACNAAFFQDSEHAGLDPSIAATRAQRRGLQALSRGGNEAGEPPPSPAAPAAASTPARRRDDALAPLPAAPAAAKADLIDLRDPLPPTLVAESDSASSAGGQTAAPLLGWPELPGVTPGWATLPPDQPERRTVAKALARQAARRARLAALADERDSPPPIDVLLLDRDEQARADLKHLLARFGFLVHEAQDLPQAERLAHLGPFAAAFLDIRLDEADDGAGLELCQRLQGSSHGSTAVVLMSRQVRAADRVRAALARSDALLSKPLSRGDVARTLESCGIALPADERRR